MSANGRQQLRGIRCCIIAPRRDNNTILHRPWRAILRQSTRPQPSADRSRVVVLRSAVIRLRGTSRICADRGPRVNRRSLPWAGRDMGTLDMTVERCVEEAASNCLVRGNHAHNISHFVQPERGSCRPGLVWAAARPAYGLSQAGGHVASLRKPGLAELLP